MEGNITDSRCNICGKLVEGWHRYDYDGNPICDNCCINLMQGEIEELKEQLKKDNRSCKACGDNIIKDFNKEIPTLVEKNLYLIIDEGKIKLCFLEKLGKNEEDSILYISNINYCPSCGRKLAEERLKGRV